jgi:hypothetical protein
MSKSGAPLQNTAGSFTYATLNFHTSHSKHTARQYRVQTRTESKLHYLE